MNNHLFMKDWLEDNMSESNDLGYKYGEPKFGACERGKKLFLENFKDFNPIEDPDKPINILKLLEINGLEDTIWVLRANIQLDFSVIIEFSNRIAVRASSCAAAASYAAASYAAASYAADSVDAAVRAEKDKQKQDLLEVLEGENE